MDVTKIPFNSFMGIHYSNETEYLLELDDSGRYLNHLNTIHTSAQFALAEASSGVYLQRTFKEIADSTIPLVRRVDLKYKRPAEGKIRSIAFMDEKQIERVRNEMAEKGRSIATVKVEIYDQNRNVTLQSVFEWFVQKLNKT